MEEEQDRILLSSLGVKSANPEDIERVVLEKVAAVPASSLSLSLGSSSLILFPLKLMRNFNLKLGVEIHYHIIS